MRKKVRRSLSKFSASQFMLLTHLRLRLDEARARLDTLYAKQSRLSRFRTKTERDSFLNIELKSLRSHQQAQSAALNATRRTLEMARTSIHELVSRTEGIQERLEDRRERVKRLGEELAGLKEEQATLVEKRKELWREDARLTNTTNHAENELRSAERELASMMDKVCSQPNYCTDIKKTNS